jgi:hypothetical protein
MCRLTDGRCFRKIDLEIEFLKQGLATRAAGVGSNLISCFSLLFHLDPCPFGWDIFPLTDFKKQCENVIRRKRQGKMVAFFRWGRDWYVLFYLFIFLIISFHISFPFDSFVKGEWVIKKEICVYPFQLLFLFQVPNKLLLQG